MKIDLNDEGIPGYYLPDGTFKPFIIVSTFNEFISNVSSSSTSGAEIVLAFNGECKFNEELFALSLNKDFVTINKAGKYRVTIDAKLYINSSAEASCYLKKNGTIILGKNTSSSGQGGGYTYPHFTGEFDFVKGDTLVFYAKFAGWSGNKAGCNAGSELLLDYIS